MMKFITVTDPKTGQSSAMPAPANAMQTAAYAAAARAQGLVITYSIAR